MGYFREIFGPLLPVVPVENVDEAIKFVNERYGFPFCCTLLLCWLFGSATIPLLFTSSPRTRNSRAKVTLDSSRAKTKFLTFPIFHSFQRNAERCCHSQWDRHPSWGFVIILLSNTHLSHSSLPSWWIALWRCWPKWMYVSFSIYLFIRVDESNFFVIRWHAYGQI